MLGWRQGRVKLTYLISEFGWLPAILHVFLSTTTMLYALLAIASPFEIRYNRVLTPIKHNDRVKAGYSGLCIENCDIQGNA